MEEKKLKKVESPEQLNQYIRLSNPGVWIILLAILILIIGITIWGVFGKLETRINAVLISNDFDSYIYVKEEDSLKIKNGMKVILNNSDNTNDNAFEIIEIKDIPEKITEETDEYVRHIGNFKVGEWVYKCILNKNIKEGIYSSNVIVESISPILFITN